MIRSRILTVLVLGIFGFAAGCAKDAADTPPTVRDFASPYEPVEGFKLKAKGNDFQNALDTDARIEGFLGELGETNRSGPLRARLNRMINASKVDLQGLGGGPTRAVLRSLLASTKDNGRFDGRLTDVEVVGKIRDFYYKPGETMRIEVQMTTRSGRNAKKENFDQMYIVEVPAGGVTVEPRGTNSSDVFPLFGAAAFPIPASMAQKPHNGGTVNFDFKLWSVGTAVQVVEYWFADKYFLGVPIWEVYKHTDSGLPNRVKDIFTPNVNACIDMMFVKDPSLNEPVGALDNGRLPPGSAPPYYCLGRCTDPPIVNTR